MNQLIKAQKEQFLQITGSLKTNEFHETKRRALQRYAVHLSRERSLFLGGLSSPWVMETTSERNPRRARGKRAALKPPQAASHTGLETDTAASKRRRLGGTVTEVRLHQRKHRGMRGGDADRRPKAEKHLICMTFIF